MPQQPRTILPTDAQDERLAQVPLTAAYTFAYLPTVLDDAGRVKDQPAVLNGYLWPLRADEHSTDAMSDDLAALEAAGLICRYTIDEHAVIHDPAWRQRQQVARPTASTLPQCPAHDAGIDDLVGDTLRKLTDQINAFVGSASSNLDETKIRDAVGRAVEDIGFFVDPEKASTYGQMVRDLFGRPDRPAGEPDAPDQNVWDSVTDDISIDTARDEPGGDLPPDPFTSGHPSEPLPDSRDDRLPGEQPPPDTNTSGEPDR